jgi:hypothetical protein
MPLGKSPLSFFFFLALTLCGPALNGSPLRARTLGLVRLGSLPPLPALGVVSAGPAPVPPLYAGPLTAGPPVTLLLLPDAVIPGMLPPVAHALSKAIIANTTKTGRRFTMQLKYYLVATMQV